MATHTEEKRRLPRAVIGLVLAAAGCGGPSAREVENARAFEALLSAVSLQNPKELEKDARRIEERYAAGELSAAKHKDLGEIIARARAGDWGGAETSAYGFRSQFGDRGAYFR